MIRRAMRHLELGAIAPRITLTTNSRSVITQGFREGLLVFTPEDRYASTRWILEHEPSGEIIAIFQSEDFRLGRAILRLISAWDWRGAQFCLVSQETLLRYKQLYKEFDLGMSSSEIAAIVNDRRKQVRKSDR